MTIGGEASGRDDADGKHTAQGKGAREGNAEEGPIQAAVPCLSPSARRADSHLDGLCQSLHSLSRSHTTSLRTSVAEAQVSSVDGKGSGAGIKTNDMVAATNDMVAATANVARVRAASVALAAALAGLAAAGVAGGVAVGCAAARIGGVGEAGGAGAGAAAGGAGGTAEAVGRRGGAPFTADSLADAAALFPAAPSSAWMKRTQCCAATQERQAVRAISFSDCGRMLAYGSNTRTLKVCVLPIAPLAIASAPAGEVDAQYRTEEDGEQTKPLEELFQRPMHHAGSIYCISWSANGSMLATGSNDQRVKLIRVQQDSTGDGGSGSAVGGGGRSTIGASSKATDDFELCGEGSTDQPGHDGAVRGLCFSKLDHGEGSQLLSVEGGCGSLRVWDVMAGGRTGDSASLVSILDGHTGPVFCVQSPAGGCAGAAWQAVTGGGDKTVRVWDLRTDSCTSTIRTAAPVHAVCYHPTDPMLIATTTGLVDYACAVWDLRMSGEGGSGRGRMMPLQQLSHHEHECRSIQFSPADGKWLLTGSFDGTAAVVEWAKGNSAKEDFCSSAHAVRTYSQPNSRVLQARWHPTLQMLAYSVQGQGGDAVVQVDRGTQDMRLVDSRV
jgi:WD40 repeat protein